MMRTKIIIEKTNDGGIIAHLQVPNGDGTVLVILSGGNWEYDDPVQAENDEILEVFRDAKQKGIFVDFQSVDIMRLWS